MWEVFGAAALLVGFVASMVTLVLSWDGLRRWWRGEQREVPGEVASSPSGEDAAPLLEEVSPLDALATGVFVGRTSELEQLHANVDQAIAGAGRLTMLVGEPGIGKTRTAQEVMRYAQQRNVQVLAGRCYEAEGAPAYWPWMQIIRTYIHDQEPATLREEMGGGAAAIGQVISEVGERLPDLPPLSALEPEQARFRLFDGITMFLKNASQKQPLLLVLDDLHWADKPSLLLLHFVTRALQGSRIFVLGTYRDVEVQRGHPLAEVLPALRSEPVYERVLLRGLPEADVRTMIEEIGREAPPGAFARAVFQQTEGNPFFVEETLRYLIEQEIIYREEGRWTSDLTPEQMGMPEGVRDVIGRRFARLSERCNEVLTLASVIGREFSVKAVARASKLSSDGLLEVLEEPLSARIVEEMPRRPDRYRFAHALIRETLYDELTTHRRLRLHRQIGTVLEELYGVEAEAHLGELAHHFVEAAPGGDVDKAVSYAIRAADHAAARVAHEEEAGHYERAEQALEFKEPPEPQRQCELLLLRGDALWKAGDTVGSRATFRRAVDLSRQVGSAEFLARAALGYGRLGYLGLIQGSAGLVDEFLSELLREVLTGLPSTDSPLRARVLARLAIALGEQEAPERRVAVSREAVEMARRLGDPATLGFTLSTHYLALWGPETVVERSAIADEIVQLAETAGDRVLEQQGHDWRITSLMELGEVEAADREIDLYTRRAHELRQPHYLLGAASVASARAAMKGDFERAEALAREALAIGQRIGDPFAHAAFVLQFLFTRILSQQRSEEVLDVWRSIEPVVADLPSYRAWRAGMGWVYLHLGRNDEARAELEWVAAQDFATLPRDSAWASAMAGLAEVCAGLRDSKRAAVLYDLLLPYVRLNIIGGNFSGCVGSASHYLGLLAETLSQFDTAEAHFKDALEFNRKIKAPPLLARTQVSYAELLLDHGGPERRAEALGILDEALDTANRLGSGLLIDRGTKLKLQVERSDPGAFTSSPTAPVGKGSRG